MANDIGMTASMLKAVGLNSPELHNSSQIEKSRSNHSDSSTTTITSRSIRPENMPSRNDLDSEANKINKNEGQDLSGIRFFRHSDMPTAEERNAFSTKRSEHTGITVHAEMLQYKMKSMGQDFKEEVENAIPSLAGKTYGISVDNKGELTLIGDNVSKAYNKTLNELNGADALRNLANQFVSVISSWTEADKKLDGNGVNIDGVEVTRENFGDFVDITSTLQDNTISGSTFHYLIDKYGGKHGYQEQSTIDEFRGGEWVRIKTKGEWVDTKV